MSDNTSDEEQQQQMEEIFICPDIWLEIFAFISPRELGQLMALISDRFDHLVAEHFKTRKWSLGWLGIVRAIDGNGAQIVNKLRFRERLPIPQGPIPNKVIGVKFIFISYIDRSAIEFLQRLRRLFDSSEATVAIFTFEDQSRSWDIIRQKIWPLISDSICRLCLDFSDLGHLRQLSPTVLRNCTKLQMIDAHEFIAEPGAMPIGLFPEFPADDNANASSNKAVAKWLLTSREDGRPKMLSFGLYSGGGMDKLKEAFVNASEPVNFIICLHSYGGTEPFGLNNNLGERLELRCFGEYEWMLVRCPIERDEGKWAVWEKEATAVEFRQWNCIDIHFNDMDIGDGMLYANNGRPKK